MSDLQPGPAIWRYGGPKIGHVQAADKVDLIELRNLLRSIDARLRTLECELIRQRGQGHNG